MKVKSELRDYGNRKTVVVFTNDNEMATKLRKRKRLIRLVPYEQQLPNRIKLVGLDFYFPVAEKQRLLHLGVVKT